jgi:hypothetical protein
VRSFRVNQLAQCAYIVYIKNKNWSDLAQSYCRNGQSPKKPVAIDDIIYLLGLTRKGIDREPLVSLLTFFLSWVRASYAV